jgi:hypothetical protein
MLDRPGLELGDLLGRSGNALTRWALGFGLLSLHATLFAVSMVALVLWNIYASPRDLWVDEVFRNWGALFAFHAICVTAGTIAWRLLRAEQEALAANQRTWTQPAVPVAQPSQVAPYTGAGPITAAPTGPSHGGQALKALRRADRLTKRGVVASLAVIVPAFNRLADALEHQATRVIARKGAGAAAAKQADPTVTWPQPTARNSPDDEEFITKFAGPASAQPPAQQGNGQDVVIGYVLSGVTPASMNGAPPAPVKDPGKSWVETAAFAWHRPHDEGVATNPAPETPERANGSGTAASERPNAPGS